MAGTIYALLGAILYSLIGAAFVEVSARWIAGARVRYLRAFKLALIIYVLGSLTASAAAVVLEDDPFSPASRALGLVISLAIGAWIFGTRLCADDRPIGIGRGLVVALATWIPAVAVAFGLGVLAGMLTGGTPPP